MAGKPSIVFAHGLWADGSCFSKLIPTLQAEGHEVFASQHGLDSLEGDVACVNFTLNHVPVRSCSSVTPTADADHQGGHPRPGGRAGLHRRAWPRRGRDLAAAAGQVRPHARVRAHRGRRRAGLAEGLGYRRFCGDLPEAEQKLVLATGAAPIADIFEQQVPGTAWKTKPSWFIVANQDQTVNPDLERLAPSDGRE